MSSLPTRLFSSVGQSTWFVISGSLVRIRQEAQNSKRTELQIWGSVLFAFYTVLSLLPNTIFAFLTVQNYELSALRNLLLEIREFWAFVVIVLIFNVLCGYRPRPLNFYYVKNITFKKKCSPFALQLYSICLPTVLHLLFKCSPFAMQGSLEWRVGWCRTLQKP